MSTAEYLMFAGVIIALGLIDHYADEIGHSIATIIRSFRKGG